MMKKALLLLLAFISLQLSFGQVIRMQAGPTISNLDWSIENIKRRGPEKILMGKSVFIGLDYLERRYFNLSTNIGYLRKGDIGEITYITDEGEALELPMMKAVFDYFSANTLAEFKFPIRQWIIPYISLGPRIDYLYSYSEDFRFIEDMDELHHYSFGVNMGGGIKFDFTRLQVGIRSDYYFNMNKIADWVSKSDIKDGWIDDKTYLVNLTVGYKLR